MRLRSSAGMPVGPVSLRCVMSTSFEPVGMTCAMPRSKRSCGVINASWACARRYSSRMARLSIRRCQSAFTDMLGIRLLEIVSGIVPFQPYVDGASLPCCHFGLSRHGYCALQHAAMKLVATSTKRSRTRMAVIPDPLASGAIAEFTQ